MRTDRRADRRGRRERMRRSRWRLDLEVGKRVAAQPCAQFRVSGEPGSVERRVHGERLDSQRDLRSALERGVVDVEIAALASNVERPAPARARAHVPRTADGDVGRKAIGEPGLLDERRDRQVAEAAARVDRVAHPCGTCPRRASRRLPSIRNASSTTRSRAISKAAGDASASLRDAGHAAHAQALDAAAPDERRTAA